MSDNEPYGNTAMAPALKPLDSCRHGFEHGAQGHGAPDGAHDPGEHQGRDDPSERVHGQVIGHSAASVQEMRARLDALPRDNDWARP